MGVKQQQWMPTVRRGPIAAEIKSPAPNFVDLPPLLGKLLPMPIAGPFQFKFMVKYCGCVVLLKSAPATDEEADGGRVRGEGETKTRLNASFFKPEVATISPFT